ncbi:DedA family protein [Paraferrimonas sedimenticola]|uniref:Membrane protein DedA, SNARE-associated domain n=1 Tax=Paraferrimonas sedimenticola TaxID=375674 RepID=A0AA37RV23_9GAMM|nr:hypothetical protein [Paraferrimonas sedimenticola]GLP95761.1 hypothetical protein GCM10007895_10670 [Paraferrimonas sedimenticola]
MQRASTLPLTALVAFCSIQAAIYFGWLPPADQLLQTAQQGMGSYLYWFAFLIILLESIVYVGFYFPGQFFAVLLVIAMQPGAGGVAALTLAMVAAATIGSCINYGIGYRLGRASSPEQPQTKLRHLLLAMIHINALAFFMLNRGVNRANPKVVLLAGLLNLPYYLALIAATSLMSEQVGRLAENTYMLLGLILVWLVVALGLDYKRARADNQTQEKTPA